MCTTYYLENTEPLRRMGQAAENHQLRYRMMSKIAQPVVTQAKPDPATSSRSSPRTAAAMGTSTP